MQAQLNVARVSWPGAEYYIPRYPSSVAILRLYVAQDLRFFPSCPPRLALASATSVPCYLIAQWPCVSSFPPGDILPEQTFVLKCILFRSINVNSPFCLLLNAVLLR